MEEISDTKTYEQMTLPNGGVITFNVDQQEGLNKIRKWLKSDEQFFTLAGYAGTGKAQCIDNKVVTPNGYKKIGDLKIGDEIFSPNGNIIKVNGVFPQGKKQAYKVTFRDKSFTECNDEHLWNVWTKKLRQNNRPCKTLTLKEIMKSGLTRGIKKKQYNFSIPLSQPVKFKKKELPIHPYLLGILIGDGHLSGNSVSLSNPNIDKEIIDIINFLIPKYIEIKKFNYNDCPIYRLIDNDSHNINKLKDAIKSFNLNVKSEFKFIPEIYKYSSIEQRWELLRGLMDTDGTSRGNRISFSTSSLQLRNDVIELVQSLGGIAIPNKDDIRHENVNYSINIKTFENPFKIKRKANNWKFSKKNPPSRYITSIEKSRVCEHVCISVNSEDGLYLTDNYIVTHNTTLIKKIIDEYRGKLAVSAPTHKAKKVIMRTTQQDGQTLHGLLGLRPDVELDDFNPNDPKYNPLAPPRISDYNLVIIDEASMINQELYELIKDTIRGWNTVKVLFMGDPAQIPPIGEKESVVFDGTIKDKHELTHIMRQEDGNPLFEIFSILRNNLKNSTGGFERKSKLNSKGEGVIFTKNKSEFREKLTNIFDSVEFRRDFDYAKVIAWRNNTVMKANKLIREIIYGENVHILEVGDILMAYRSIRAKQQYFNIVDNSVDYRVKNVSKRIQNSYDLWGYKIKIEELLGNGTVQNKSIFIIDHTDHENLHNYAEIHDGLKEIAKSDKKEWRKYYAFRRDSMIMTTIKKFRDGDIRQRGDVIAKDFDYGFCITSHKAQGSTYRHVFILEDDMSLNSKIKERNQIKYVALTRPIMTATVLTK